MPSPSGPSAPSGPSRRTVVRGAAWATPVVAMATTAPAFAASPCTSGGCPTLSFGAVSAANATTAGNGWSYAVTAGAGGWGNTNPTGFQPAITAGNDPLRGKGTWFAATSEPSTANRVLTLTQTGQPALVRGCSYRISVGVVTWTDATTQPLVLKVLVGGSEIGQYSTAAEPSAGYTDRGIKTFTVPSTASGAVGFRFVFGPAGGHEDIKLYQPSITCG